MAVAARRAGDHHSTTPRPLYTRESAERIPRLRLHPILVRGSVPSDVHRTHERCPSEESLALYFGGLGQVSRQESEAIEQHLNHCDECRDAIVALARTSSVARAAATPLRADGEPPSDVPLPEVGIRLGRYVVGAPLGAGAMGLVCVAYDPELDRRVAIKVVHERVRRTKDEEAVLLREARALARIRHPNVVTVHDAGITDGQVWLAMELVQGETLGVWLQSGRRGWREIVVLLVQAGRGLKAVHAAGLLHRDLKPANVMVESTEDGPRARVMDFGLVRASPAESLQTVDTSTAQAAAAIEHTASGVAIGTPAYMSPEQLEGGRATAASDQFSFCVTLWEALYGCRPFAASTITDLRHELHRGAPARASRVAVPGWLRRIVARGLSVDPAKRWPSMEALLDALRRGEASTRRRRSYAVATVVACCGIGLSSWRSIDRGRRVTRCEDDARQIRWDELFRDALRGRLDSSRADVSAQTAELVIPRLDRYAEAWSAASMHVCMAASVNDDWSDATRERATWCLDDRKQDFEALVTELTAGGDEAWSDAVLAVASLRYPEVCLDVAYLDQLPVIPRAAGQEIRAARAELSTAGALERTGSCKVGIDVARRVVSQAEAVGWEPLVAEARALLGNLLLCAGAYADAERELEAAYFVAATARVPEATLKAAEGLVWAVGIEQGRYADGMRWSQLAAVTLSGLRDPARTLQERHLSGHANLLLKLGKLDAAAQLHEQALEINEQELGEGHVNTAASLLSLAAVAEHMGFFDEARARLERAVAILRQELGPRHPRVGKAVSNLASVALTKGDHDRARELFVQSLQIAQEAFGDEHVEVAYALQNLAALELSLGDLDTAKPLLERALAAMEDSFGPESPDLAAVLMNLAAVHSQLGSFTQAEALCRRALAIRERALGPDHAKVAASLTGLAAVYQMTHRDREAKELHERALTIMQADLTSGRPEVARTKSNLGHIYVRLGDRARARELFDDSLAQLEKTLGPEHPLVAEPLTGLADLAIAAGEFDSAVSLAERALTLRQADTPSARAEAQVLLAQALAKAHRDPDRVLELVTRARDTYEADPAVHREQLEEIERLLRAGRFTQRGQGRGRSARGGSKG